MESFQFNYLNPLLIIKTKSDIAMRYGKLIFKYLLKKEKINNIYIESSITSIISEIASDSELKKIKILSKDPHNIDLCIILGGDGTVLYCNSLFDNKSERPPFITFNLGTLGYMTYYKCNMYKEILDELYDNPYKSISYERRSTLQCKLINDKDYNQYIILNDIVIERGETNRLITIDIYINDQPFTNIKGDGIIICTSTGSTAYSLSAGGTIIHHDLDCIILNAICPQSLSFRPIAFHKDIIIKVIISDNSFNGYMTYDGINRLIRKPGEGVEITISDKYVSIIILERFISTSFNLWKNKIIDKLGWNNAFKNIK